MKKKLFFMLLFCAVLLIIRPTKVQADIGPKPSVVIDFKGLEDEVYYVTLLSEIASTGPYSSLDKFSTPRYEKDDAEYEIWQKFVSYKDKDEFHFLQYFKDCTETSQFIWGYYPPAKFKILIYFPEHDTFAVSQEVYEKYAFDSYYKVETKGFDLQSLTLNEEIRAEKNYNYSWEFISLIARIFATITIEVLIALLFGFRGRKLILFIVAVNVATQSILNILLNIINYNLGSLAFVFNYVWMEVLVLIIEARAYSIYINKHNSIKARKKWLIPVYALTANLVSFGFGLYLGA